MRSVPMEAVIEQLLFPIIVGLCAYLVPFFMQSKKETKKKKAQDKKERDIRNKIDIFNLQHVLQEDYRFYMKQNHITLPELENWQRKFRLYKEIGGNSIMIDMNDEIRALPKREGQT